MRNILHACYSSFNIALISELLNLFVVLQAFINNWNWNILQWSRQNRTKFKIEI